MTHDQMVAVILAHKNGKKIQCRGRLELTGWEQCEAPWWDFRVFDYRVKPEPREWFLRSHNGEPCASCGFHDSRKAAERPAADKQPTHSIIHIREIL